MANTQEIEKAANDLGKLIAEHTATKELASAETALEGDVGAQRLMTDFNRMLRSLHEKQQTGRPIEPMEKQRLQSIQDSLATHPLVGRLQMAQMNYYDLMRKAYQMIDKVAKTGLPQPPAAPGPTGPAAAGPQPGPIGLA